jgi:vacuolar-type H+-ATPase subunit I/STV1
VEDNLLAKTEFFYSVASDNFACRKYERRNECERVDEQEEIILPPHELIQQYQEKRASLNADIDRILAEIETILGWNYE